MALEPVIDPETGSYTDDFIIAKAFEGLRAEFHAALPATFAVDNWERARLIMKVEGRHSQIIAKALRPFAEAQSGAMAIRERNTAEFLDQNRDEFPQLCRLIEKGLL